MVLSTSLMRAFLLLRMPRHRSRERRSRSRSRDRSRSRRRRSPTPLPRLPPHLREGSEAAEDELRRSVSRELLRDQDQLGEIKAIVESQQEVILNLLSEHKAEVDSKIQTKSRRFASRQIEKQYQVNANFKELAQKALAALEASDVQRAADTITTLVGDLEKHEEDLIIADTSPHGWLAVSKVRAGTELSKSLRKKLAQVEKDLAQRKNGGFKKKRDFVSKQGDSGSGRRNDRRVSPEEALTHAAKQLRPGTCSHCQKGLHYYRECPEFWKKVMQSREAQAGTAATTGN
jgi:hypothetical protein